MPSESPPNQLSRRELIFLGIFWCILAATAVGSFGEDYPVAQLACSFSFFYFVAVFIHEMGHALGAVWTGGSVDYIQLGQVYSKRDPWKFNALGFRWRIYSTPASGAVYASHYTANNYRLRRCLMIAAGPLANVLCIIPGLFMIDFNQNTRLSMLLVSWTLANGSILFYSIPPRPMNYARRRRPNDGLLFWQTLHYSDAEIQAFIGDARLTRKLTEDSAAAKSLSIPDLLARYDANPATDWIYLWHALNEMHESNDPHFAQYALKFVDNSEVPQIHRARYIDLYLTHQLNLGPPALPEISDELSKKLLLFDDSISTRGTRGSVLVDLGRIEEGKAMLHEVLNQTSSTVDKVYSNIFLALAEKQQGNLAVARACAQLAEKHDPACPALSRVADLIS